MKLLFLVVGWYVRMSLCVWVCGRGCVGVGVGAVIIRGSVGRGWSVCISVSVSVLFLFLFVVCL